MNRTAYITVAVLALAASIPARAQQQPSTSPQARVDSPSVVTRSPATRFATIQGSAVRTVRGGGSAPAVQASSEGAVIRPPDGDPIPNLLVRLRDVRYGRSAGTQLTDKTGSFQFQAIDPGNYIVEIVATNQSAIASTQLISANAGETINTVVRMPGQVPVLSTLFGGQGPGAMSVGPAGVMSLVPSGLDQLPIVLVQSVPAVVAVNPATSDR